MEMEELKAKIIDNTIIAALKENNIFESIMTVEQVREKLMNIVQSIEYEDIEKEGANGYWTKSTGRIAIDQRFQNELEFSDEHIKICIHELLHALSTNENYVGLICYNDSDVNIDGRGRGFNEGITEYLAQKLCSTEEYSYFRGEIEFPIQGSYPLEQQIIKKIAILYGEDKIIDAYLNNCDIDMPSKEYIYLRESFDHINIWEDYIRICEHFGDKSLVRNYEEKVEKEFMQSQEYLLINWVLNEIKDINTLEQIEEVQEKFNEATAFVNKGQHNFLFIQKYISILSEQKDIENIEKMGKLKSILCDMLPEYQEKIIGKIHDDESKLEKINNKSDYFFEPDDKKIESLKEIDDEWIKVRIIESLTDDNKKIEALKGINNKMHQVRIIRTVIDEDKKIEALKEIQDEWTITAVTISLTDDDKKIEFLKDIKDEDYKARIIASLADDAKKIEFLKDIKDEDYKTGIIASLADDGKKIEFLNDIKDEDYKARIIASLTDDAKKIEFLNDIKGKIYKARIIASLADDNKKEKLLKKIENKVIKEMHDISLTYEWQNIMMTLKNDKIMIELLSCVSSEVKKLEIIKKLTDDAKKIEALKYIKDERDKVKVIESLTDEDKKIEMLKTIEDEYDKVKIIEGLTAEDKKIEMLKTIEDERDKVKIIESLTDNNKKIEALEYIKDENNIIRIIEKIENDESKLKLLSKTKEPKVKLIALFFIKNDTPLNKICDYIEDKEDKEEKVKLVAEAKGKRKILLKLKKLNNYLRKANEQLKEDKAIDR